MVQVLRHHLLTAGLGDDRQPSLGRPPEQHLRRLLLVLLGDGVDGVVLHEGHQRLGVLEAEADERGGAERGVGGDGDALLFSEFDEFGLDEVGVVLDLEGGGGDLGGAEEVVDQLGLEVGDPDAASELLPDQVLLEALPGLRDGGVAPHDLGLAVLVPARGVANGGVDPFEGYGEVDEVEVEVVDPPVAELLADDGLDFVGVVEGVPELGDDEELLALDEAFLDGAGYALSALDLVAIIWRRNALAM